ncbi:MAG: family 43 glycosylhydrolase [Bacteroidales bacterium]|nr:family 43 glycosylhydrolase [Bacteroidales bacterium]
MKRIKFLVALMATIATGAAMAQNPVVWTKFTADPAPMVEGDTLFLYTTHDADTAENFAMYDWLLYTTTDMANFTDRGSVASLDDFKWYDNKNGAWAEQVIKRNGKYYMYCPIHGHGIGVLVSDTPYGPFKDPIGQPMIWQKEHWYDIDPSPFIDDNGQACLYWGNPRPYYCKLNRDMISYSGGIVRLEAPKDYQEGPWMFKKDNWYYMAFASTCCPEGIGYAMSHSIEGPWEAKGDIMPHTQKSRGNHPGIVPFGDKWYVFGLNYDVWATQLKQQGKEYRHAERRSVSVAEMKFNEDGTIQKIDYWDPEGVKQIKWLDPFKRVEAETMAKAEWVKTQKSDKGIVVTNIENGDYIMLRGVDMATGAKTISVSAMPKKAGKVEIRLDSKEGELVGTVDIKGKAYAWKIFQGKLNAKATGIHNLYLVFKGEGSDELFVLDWWKMSK